MPDVACGNVTALVTRNARALSEVPGAKTRRTTPQSWQAGTFDKVV